VGNLLETNLGVASFSKSAKTTEKKKKRIAQVEAQERQKDKFEVQTGGKKPKAPDYNVQCDIHSQPHSVTGSTPAHST